MTRKSQPKVPRRRKPVAELEAFTLDPLPTEHPLDVEQGLLVPAEAARSRKPASKKAKPGARCAIVAAAFWRSTDAGIRKLLASRPAIAVVILVPGPDWVEPVMTLFFSRYGAAWQPAESSAGIVTELLKAERNAQVAMNLSRGLPVVGVATQADTLPAALTRGADLTIRIRAPDGVCIGRAVRLFTGAKSFAAIDDDTARGLGFHDLIAAFRKRSSPADILERLRKTGAALRTPGTVERLPKLHDAVEYGAAREWGLLVAKDVADLKAEKLKNWKDTGGRAAVLHGISGLGKTTFGRVLASALDAHFLSFSCAELFQNSAGYLDSVIKASRVFFDRAAELAAAGSPTAPSYGAWSGSCCVLLIDEIDAIGNRATMTGGEGGRGSQIWWTNFVTSFLLAIENAAPGVIILGCTNHLAAVDAALLRPGRLERTIELKLPEHAGIVQILRHHLDGALRDADLTDIGNLLAGSTPAEIMMVVRSARRTARNAGRGLELDDLIRTVAPIEHIEPGVLLRVSIHESAHAIASLVVPAGHLQRCIIGGQADSPGRTIIAGETHDLPDRDAIERRAIVTLAGRSAERLLLGGSVALGSGGDEYSDLATVTKFIASLHASTGLGGSLVYLTSHADALEAVRNDRELRDRVERDMRRLQARADDVVRKHCKAIVAVAEQLRLRRHLSGDEIRSIFKATPPPIPSARPTRH